MNIPRIALPMYFAIESMWVYRNTAQNSKVILVPRPSI